VALITGVAWDHINVFPVYEGYVNQFKKFVESVEAGGAITYYREDTELKKIFAEYKGGAKVLPYTQPEYFTKGHSTFILSEGKEYEMSVFGAHNMQNIEGARIVCKEVGISNEDFMKAISSFEGAANRLQFLGKNEETVIYKDFAHSPSKLKATVKAMREQFADRQLVAVMELHTYSSLNKDFLSEYSGSMDAADAAIVFIDKEAMLLKRMPDLDESLIRESFGRNDLQIFTEKEQLIQYLLSTNWKNKNLLLMTSGQFGGMKVEEVRDEILKNK
jgi:UDP-N-acetylmuramate: L-alanyl-gamma-D-glutamyl-meso-diaminopimelate ligase